MGPRSSTSVALMLLALAVAGATAQEVAPSLPRVFVQAPDGGPLANGLASLKGTPRPGLRVPVDLLSDEGRQAAERAVSQARTSDVALWLAVSAPRTEADVASWRTQLRSLLRTAPLRVLELRFENQPRQLAAFVTQVTASEAAVSPDVRIALGGDLPLPQLYTPSLAPYVDAVAVTSSRREEALRHLAAVDPEAIVLVVPGSEQADLPRSVVDEVLRSAGTAVKARAWTVLPEDLPLVAQSLGALGPVLAEDVTELDASAAALSLQVGGDDVSARVPHRLLFDNRTLATLLVYWGEALPDPMRVRVTVPTPGVPVVYDLLDGARNQAANYQRDDAAAAAAADVPLTGRPMLVNFSEEATEIFADTSGVTAARRLTADEIIARHRRQQARQDAAVDSYIARVRMQQHFRPTITDPGYDIVTENRYFVDREGIEWEELSFSVNGSKWGEDRPPLPMLQPEKVLSLPLQLRFDEDYRYSLARSERVDGYDCYVLRFEPVRSDKSLYRGTLWIDSRTFARVRVQAVQTGLSAPVVSNEEIQAYRPVELPGGMQAFLLSSLTARQIVMIAGRNILLEKNVTFESFDVNPADFAERRQMARASDRIMYRETDAGLRYFIKEGERRVISDRGTSSARAAAIGVTIDPSYSFPLPMLGINYLDFEFRDPETQLAVLFAGVLAAGNIQRPRIAGTPLDASVDFFAIAVPSNDRVYRDGGERREEGLLTWPLTAGANLGWQTTPFQKLGVQYQFRFDGFIRDRDTAESFVTPASTTTHGLGLSWEYRRWGYSLVLNGTWNRRVGWHEWGDPLAPEVSSPTYAKYTATLARDFLISPFQKVHVDAAWFGGSDLDRLSRYQFGLFDPTRIHGVPSSGLRFDDLFMVRGSYSFNVFEQYRLDLFLDQAWGRDETFDRARQPITGIGAAVNMRTPWWGTMLRADLGKAFLPRRYDGTGSVVLQVMLLKPLR